MSSCYKNLTGICNINYNTKKIQKSYKVVMALLYTVEGTPKLSAQITLSNK